MKQFFAICIVALLVGVGVWGFNDPAWRSRLLVWPNPEPRTETRKASAPETPSTVIALGRLRPARNIVNVSAGVGDRLGELSIMPGDRAKKGDELGLLHSHHLRKLEKEAAASQLAEAQARYQAESILADSRIESARLAVQQAEDTGHSVNAQLKQIEAAKKNRDLAEKDLQRLKNLSSRLVTDQERERQELVLSKAIADLHAAEAEVDANRKKEEAARTTAALSLANAKATKDQVLAAIPLKSAEINAELAELQLAQSLITAPSDGTVLEVFVRPGEFISQKPILQMADLTEMVCIAEVFETDAKRISVGQRAQIKSDAFKPPYDKQGLTGTVARIGRTIGSAELQGFDPLQPVDRHAVSVEIKIADKHVEQASSLINLQVEVRLKP